MPLRLPSSFTNALQALSHHLLPLPALPTFSSIVAFFRPAPPSYSSLSHPSTNHIPFSIITLLAYIVFSPWMLKMWMSSPFLPQYKGTAEVLAWGFVVLHWGAVGTVSLWGSEFLRWEEAVSEEEGVVEEAVEDEGRVNDFVEAIIGRW